MEVNMNNRIDNVRNIINDMETREVVYSLGKAIIIAYDALKETSPDEANRMIISLKQWINSNFGNDEIMDDFIDKRFLS